MSRRLPNGLTPEQDAALDRLAEAIRDHYAPEGQESGRAPEGSDPA